MKTPKLFSLLAFLAILVLALTACSAPPYEIQASQAVQIPLELKVAINGALLLGVTLGLQWVFDKIKLDLRGIGVGLAVGLSEFAILQLQGLIDVVPMEYDFFVTLGLNILLAILTGLGLYRAVFQRQRASEFLAT